MRQLPRNSVGPFRSGVILEHAVAIGIVVRAPLPALLWRTYVDLRPKALCGSTPDIWRPHEAIAI